MKSGQAQGPEVQGAVATVRTLTVILDAMGAVGLF